MLTLDEIREDAAETLNNYGERFKVEVVKLYPDDPDDDTGEMTITALRGDRVLFRTTCFVRPIEEPFEDWDFDFTDADNWTSSGSLWEVLAHMLLDHIEKGGDR